MSTVPWSLGASLIIFHTIGAAVESFFTYRVYVLSGQWWLALPLWTLQLFMMGIVPYIVVLSIKSDGLLQFKDRYDWLVYLCLITAAIVSFAHHLHGWTRINRNCSRLTWVTPYCYVGFSRAWTVGYIEPTRL
jgi:hypothetical protein